MLYTPAQLHYLCVGDRKIVGEIAGMKSHFQVRIVRSRLETTKKIILKRTEKEKSRHELQYTLIEETKSSQKCLT